MNRRGFLGAMAGMPIAAIVQPKPESPAVLGGSLPSELRAREDLPQMSNVNIRINNVRPLTARDRDELARVIGDALTSQALRVPRGF